MLYRAFYLLSFALVSLFTTPVVAQEGDTDIDVVSAVQSAVHIVIEGEIEHGVAAYLKRGVDSAKESGAAAIIVEINTPGGRLDSALSIKDFLMDARTDDFRTIAFVNRHAYSAGALIALAAEEIYMVKGGVIGAATPVDGAGHKLEEKMVSATRAVFAATAERYGRDGEIARAMVDDSIEIDGLNAAGKLLTLNAQQAADLGFINGQVAEFDAMVDAAGLGDVEILPFPSSAAEDIVRFITSPMVASLLLSIAMIAVFAEFKAPGMGYGGVIAILCYALFFWGHHLAGMAGWEDVALVVAGIVFIAIEVFILPGFGVFGILGMVAILGGFYISLIGDVDSTPQEILLEMSGVVSLALIGAVVVMIVGYLLVFRRAGFDSGIILGGSLERSNKGTQKQATHDLEIGEIGVALSDLRPSGSAQFGEVKVSVSSDGAFIDAGSSLEIIQLSGSNVFVRIKSS